VRETKVEKALVDGVELRGGVCLKWTSPGRKGAPDRIVLMPGAHVVFVETKAPDGVLKSWQGRFHTMLRWLGFRVEVLWTLEQVADFLETI
jgi:hypothetical protein